MKLYSIKAGTAGGGCEAVVVVLMVLIASHAVLGKAQSSDQFLSAHNTERASVGVAGLVWNSTVASYAQSYAAKQRDQANCALVHSGGPYGESLFWSSSDLLSPTDAVNLWISEKQYYDYASNTCAPGKVCSHYTQVVWQNSLRLGCSITACNDSGGSFAICNYDPPGNILGQRPYSIDYSNPTGQPSPSPPPSTSSPSPQPSPSSPPAETGNSTPPPPSSPAGLGKNTLIAIAIASTFAACVGLGFAMFLYSRARKQRLLINKQASQAEEELRKVLPLLPNRFSYQDLHEATKGFSKLLGEGGCGSVYAGMLRDGRKVAVKTLEFNTKHQSKQFLAEVGTIGQTSHYNIVRLVGFCLELSSRLLVYEYMERGSLDHWLFHKRPNDASCDKGVAPLLDWQTRYNVVLGIVRGLSYLHEECPQPILHFDIKPQNILLDGAFVPKLADFGMSRLMQRDVSEIVTGLRGTPGYIAPEWLLHGAVSKKGDIYSMGMVMLEIVGGRKNIDLELLNNINVGLEEEQLDQPWHFPSWAARKCEQGLEMELVDKRLQGAFNESEARRLIYTGFWCIQEEPAMRPYVLTVQQWLEGISLVKKPPFLSASQCHKPSSSSHPLRSFGITSSTSSL